MVVVIQFMKSIRNNFSLEKHAYLFGIPGTENPINGYCKEIGYSWLLKIKKE